MTPRDPFDRAGWLGFGILVFLLLMVPAACHVSQAQTGRDGIRLSAEACKNLVEAVQSAAEARDDGVKHQRYAARVAQKMAERNSPEIAIRILQRELRRVFTSGHTVAELELDAYTRCMTGPLGGPEA